MSPEELFIQNLVTKKKIKEIKNFSILDYEKFIKLASSHLLLPEIYFRLKKIKLLRWINLF